MKAKDDESEVLNGDEKLAIVEESNETQNNEEPPTDTEKPLEMLPPTEIDNLNTSNN